MIANSTKSGSKILVDADACPVKEAIVKIAGEFGVNVILIASIAHKTETTYPNTEQVWVDSSPQAVDMAIVNKMAQGDLIVTGDYGLASLALAKEGKAISPRGFVYTNQNIEKLLLQRHIDGKIRRAGGKTKGPKALSTEDKNLFDLKLREILKNLTGQENLYQ